MVDCYKKIILGLDQKQFSKNSKILFEIGYDQAQKSKKINERGKYYEN